MRLRSNEPLIMQVPPCTMQSGFTQRCTILPDNMNRCAIALHLQTTSRICVMQGVKGSLQGLEDSQMQSMRQLAQNVIGALDDAEASLQVRFPGQAFSVRQIKVSHVRIQ